MEKSMIQNNIAVQLLTKHKERLQKELAGAVEVKEQYITSLLKISEEIRDTRAKIDQCTDEINRVNLTYTIGSSIGTTGYITAANPTTGFFTNSSCPKQ